MTSDSGASRTGSGATAPSEGVKASHMQAAILALAAVSLPLLLVTFGLGYCVHYGWFGATVGTHLKLGLLSAFLTMLTHTTTMFYFMGTGSAIKAEVRERRLDTVFLRRARAFKGAFFYALFFGTLLIMAAAMLGGGAHADLLRPAAAAGPSLLSRIHEVLAVLSLAVNVAALAMTPVNISRNNRLLDDVFGPAESTAQGEGVGQGERAAHPNDAAPPQDAGRE